MKSCCDEYCSTHGCNQGRNCPVRESRVTDKYDQMIIVLEAALIAIMCAMGVLAWRLW